MGADDGWEVDRGPDGMLTPDPVRFPTGLRAISDKMHSLGMLFGVPSPFHNYHDQDYNGWTESCL